jgi:hypothetical protein
MPMLRASRRALVLIRLLLFLPSLLEQIIRIETPFMVALSRLFPDGTNEGLLKAELADELSRLPGVGEPAAQRRPPLLQPASPAGSTADAALKPATDQNLSEMVQRLEATLRRPAKSSDDARTVARKQAASEPFRAAPPSARLDTMLRPPRLERTSPARHRKRLKP